MDGFALRSADTDGGAGDAPGRRPDRRRRACRPAAGAGRGHGDRDRRRRARRRRRASSRSRSSRRRRRRHRARRPSLPARTFASAGATSRRARPCSSAGVLLGPGQVGALAAAGVAEVRCDEAPARRHPRHRARSSGSPARRSRPGPDLRVERPAARDRAPAGGRRARAARGRRRHRGRASPDDGAGAARVRHARDDRGRVGRATRSRAQGAGRASGRGDLLGRCDEAWEARRLRRAPRPSRLQPAREPSVGARHLRAARATRGQRAARSARAAAGVSARDARRGRPPQRRPGRVRPGDRGRERR